MTFPANENLIIHGTGDCIRIPRAAFGARYGGRPFTLSAILLQGAVFSFGNEKNGKQRECVMTYSEWEKRTGISDTTFWRAKSQLKAAGCINSISQSRYTYNATTDGGLFLRLENWVLVTPFKLKAKSNASEEMRCLTLAEAIVFSYLFTYCDNAHKKDKTITRSYRNISADLNLSEKTVRAAIYTLMRAGLVFRSKQDKGDCTGRASTYHISEKLLNRRKVSGEQKKKQEKTREWTKGEIESYYAELRHTAEDKAERSLAQALRDKKFATLYKEEKALSIRIAFTELERPLEAFVMQNRLNEIQRLKNERLKELGLNIKPEYRCSVCGDTGYDSRGKPCDCLKKLIKGVIEL